MSANKQTQQSCRIQNIKSIVFLYTTTEQSRTEIEKIIPFAIASKRIKYLGINLTKEVKDVYIENCKLLKENKWKNIPCSWIERLNIVKMMILPQAMYRLIAIYIKIPVDFITINLFLHQLR